MKLVSIIVPVYNCDKEVRNCYLSLINQTYKNLEIIFVNAGSNDNSLEVLKNFADPRVLVLYQENSGLANARKYGFSKSKGEYVCFVDSDDKIKKDFIKRLVKLIEKDNTNIAMGRMEIHLNYSFTRNIILMTRKRPNLVDFKKKPEFIYLICPLFTGKLFKREIINMERISCGVNEDIMLMYSLYIENRFVSIDNKAIYHYYLADNSQYRKYLGGYTFSDMYNTFGFLKEIYLLFEKENFLEEYYYEIEMLFIKNLSEKIWNVMQVVSDKIYRYKFISAILDYLEYFFPSWELNPYYTKRLKGFDYTNMFYIIVVRYEIRRFKRKKLYLELDEIYERYKLIEEMYEKSKY